MPARTDTRLRQDRLLLRWSTPRLALRLAIGTEHLHKDAAFRQLRCKLHRFGDTTGCGLFELHAIDHHIDEMLDLLIERTRLAIQLHYLAIDTNTAEAHEPSLRTAW